MTDNNLLISCDELRTRLDADDLRVIDCRFDLKKPQLGREQYLEGHIPGAVFADLDQDLAGPVGEASGRHPLPSVDAFAATLSRLGVSQSTHVVVYDQGSGALAARLWWLLRWLGHDIASLLDGGLDHWQRLGLPLEAGKAEVPQSKFKPAPRAQLILETAEICDAGDDAGPLQLVDARDNERFRGLVEPIDPVAGHIPGAINVPFSRSLDENGRWKSAEELQELWQENLRDGFGAPWSVMCGSGVTACHLVISGLLAGLPDPRVYVGSWSEWITDDARPVAGDL